MPKRMPTEPYVRDLPASPPEKVLNVVTSEMPDAWPIALFPVVIALVRRRVIAREEAYLERKFGDEYRAYKARVRRWI